MEEKKFKKRKERAIIDGNQELLAINCKHLADYYNEQGEYRKALKEYTQEANAYRKLSKKLEMAKANRMMGEMYILLGEFPAAKDAINTYLTLAKSAQNKVEEQRAYATLGRVYLLHSQSAEEQSASTTMEQLRAAEKAFQYSLMLTQKITNDISKVELLDMKARCYLNIGVVKENMGQLASAMENMEKAINISTTHDIFELTHMCYISMSLLLHMRKHDVTGALRYCNLALQIAKRLPDKVKKICETLIIKGDILIKATDFSSAKQILIKAYKKNTPDKNDRTIIEKNLRTVVVIVNALDELITTSIDDHAKRKLLYERIADQCCQLECYAKAAEYYQHMLECAKKLNESGKDLGPIYVSLYQTYKDDKQYDRALEYMWAEYEVLRAEEHSHGDAFTTLCSIAEVLELQHQSFFAVHDVYAKALDLAKSVTYMDNSKLLRVAFARLIELCAKHKMHVLMEDFKQEAESRGISTLEADSENGESESEGGNSEQQTLDVSAQICLDELTDSDASSADEAEKVMPEKRTTRGQRGINIKRNNKGETALHQACIAGNYELVRRLLDQGHVVNVRDHAGWLPLHEACNHGHREIVEMLLNRGAAAAVNDKGGTNCDGITPLYDACVNGFLDVVDLLLDRSADATLKTDFGETCVDGLDKWRRSASLDAVEQAQYETIRARLMRILTHIRIKPKSHVIYENMPNNYDERRNNMHCARKIVQNDHDAEKTLVSSESYDEEQKTESDHTDADENDDGDDDGLNVPRPQRRTSKANASAQYKDIMDHLKRKHRGGVKSPPNDGVSTSRRAAFMETQEIDDDMWLIDDVGPEKKKCRYKSPTRDVILVKERVSNSKQNNSASLEKKARNSFDTLLMAPQKTQQANTTKRKVNSSSRCSTGLSSASKQQSLLSEAGFFRYRSESPASVSDHSKQSNRCESPANVSLKDVGSSTLHLVISPAKSTHQTHQHAAAILPANIYFKVKVEAEMLLISIELKKISKLTIKWLAEEAARRYYNLVGLKPILRLKTADGFAFEETDALSVAAEHNLIVAAVVEWKVAALSDRYKEMCQQVNEAICQPLLEIFEHAEVTNELQITKCMCDKQFTPICKALLHQAKLSTLDLRYKLIDSKGCEELAKSLSTLTNLMTLKLRCCLNTENLNMLMKGAMESLTYLRELDLSANTFGNEGLEALGKYCQTTAAKNNLRRLRLSNCNITQLCDSLCTLPLSHLDVSFNKLTDDAVRRMLLNLNDTNLEELKLHYTFVARRHPYATQILADGMAAGKSFKKLRYLSLGGLDLTDSHIFTILNSLSYKNAVLETLDVSNNPLLTTQCLHFVHRKLPFLKKFIARQNKTLLSGDDTLPILSEWLGNQVQSPRLMIISLPMNNTPDIATVSYKFAKEITALWKKRWGNERGHTKQLRDMFIFYTDERDCKDYILC